MKESVHTVFTSESLQASPVERVSQYMEQLSSCIKMVSLWTGFVLWPNMVEFIENEVDSEHVKLDDVFMNVKVPGTWEIDNESLSDTVE
jgi:hypothetical protein